MTEPLLPKLSFSWPDGPPAEEVLTREWIVANGLGGYASGTVALVNTRRYHGLFVPTLPGHGRTVLLARLIEEISLGGESLRLDGEERANGELHCPGLCRLRAFALDGLLPEWEYELGGVRLVRRHFMVHGENTAFIAYRNLGERRLRLRLRPFVTFRFHDRPMPPPDGYPRVVIRGDQLEIHPRNDVPTLRLKVYSRCPSPFVALAERSPLLLYRTERARGLDHHEEQNSPGYFECELEGGDSSILGFTADAWEQLEVDPLEQFELERARERKLLGHAPERARSGTPARLVLAADQFVIEPFVRPQDEAWARATGRDARSVIAGYPWFTDWGRDTMISLEGLTLATGRPRSAAAILRTFQHYVREGLLPNVFPEGGREGLYHTADATMWLFHAVDRYLEATGDEELLQDLWPTLVEIVDRHVQGARFGIGVDPSDGLLRQGADGYQLTWMDAKVDGWVVTPRRGKAVEINALWFNAARLMADWAERLGREPGRFRAIAEKAYASFNRRFWNPETKCLFDVVDEDDPAVRPNQIFAISLRHPVLRRELWEPVIQTVEQELLTPVGLRTLSPSHPDYRPYYDGDLRARDAAYHQGTVWPWLLGHFVDAETKTRGEASVAHRCLEGLEAHLSAACVGQVGEIFDATEPYRARGCFAQAWSVAEMLRAWGKTVERRGSSVERHSSSGRPAPFAVKNRRGAAVPSRALDQPPSRAMGPQAPDPHAPSPSAPEVLLPGPAAHRATPRDPAPPRGTPALPTPASVRRPRFSRPDEARRAAPLARGATDTAGRSASGHSPSPREATPPWR
ncbi:MAG: glycogen debranching enzyme N-terminal domain-containing protein [Myxococcales bacterium]|nr:glycogen debranching enzyme N-terminal domain-containing protein [Myxococcales bacterium]